MRNMICLLFSAIGIAISILAIDSLMPYSGLKGAEQTPSENSLRLETLLRLERGSTLEKVRSILGMSGKHEFSALISETKYHGLNFEFEKPQVALYLVFTNDHLKAVVDPSKSEFDKVPYKGTFREIPKPVDAEKRLVGVLASQDLTREQVEQRFRQALPKSAESLNMLPTFIIAAPLFLARSAEIDDDYRTNAELAKKYDPLKIAPGTTASDVTRAFGNPYRVLNSSTNQVIHIYGNPLNLRINQSYRFSWVVVIIENGKVTRVLSNHFFDRRLLEGR